MNPHTVHKRVALLRISLLRCDGSLIVVNLRYRGSDAGIDSVSRYCRRRSHLHARAGSQAWHESREAGMILRAGCFRFFAVLPISPPASRLAGRRSRGVRARGAPLPRPAQESAPITAGANRGAAGRLVQS